MLLFRYSLIPHAVCLSILFLLSKMSVSQGSAGGEDVSVFVFECKTGNEHLLNIARSAVKRLKTLRHPSILAYLDSFEVQQ